MKETIYNIQISDGVIVRGNQVEVNGKKLPPAPGKGYNSSVIDGNVYLDGYEFNFKKNKWQRTLRALWYLYF